MNKILVIEDEQSLRKDIIEMLSFEGFEVYGAANGADGVQRAHENIPDLIICDIMMPELDGYGVLAELRKETRTAAIPFIFLTARTDKLDRRQGMDQGADDYLTKPFTVMELLKSVHTRLEKRAAITEISEQRLEDLRDNIILAMPHELRTPLTVILGFSDILTADCDTMKTSRIREMTHHINKAAMRLYHLVENYLVYAQIEMLVTDPKSIELLRASQTTEPKIVLEDQFIQKAQSYERESDLTMAVEDVPAVQIMEDYLKKLVDELIDNAFKFSEADTPVTVTGGPDGDMYRLQITNSGRGMTAEQIEAVGAYMQFNRRFYEQQGSGLGLVICSRLAELHGGELKLESEPGKFTTITVALPLSAGE